MQPLKIKKFEIKQKNKKYLIKKNINKYIQKEDKLYSFAMKSYPDNTFYLDDIHNVTVFAIKNDKILVKLNLTNDKSHQALININEISNHSLKIDDEILVYIENTTNKNITPKLQASIEKALCLSAGKKISMILHKESIIKGIVVSSVKGGYSVSLFSKNRNDIEKNIGLRGFLPIKEATLSVNEKLEYNLDSIIDFNIKDINLETGSIILSRKSILSNYKKKISDECLKNISVGEIIEGLVKTHTSYGAFVDIGGFDGLLHISDLAWNRQANLQEIAPIGSKIDIKILEVNRINKRLRLGIKQLFPDPWKKIKNRLYIGKQVNGVIVALTKFGAFVKLGDNIEGLIHLSEISWKRVKHPSECFKIGTNISALILNLDEEDRRISLSTKALEKSPVERMAEELPVGAILEAKIANFTNFGIFVELNKNVSGLVHIGEVSWTKHIKNPSELYKKDEKIKVVVLNYDPQKQRVSCSIKRVTDNPWKTWRNKYAKGTHHTAIITYISQQGVKCKLEENLYGFCRMQELSHEYKERDSIVLGLTINVEVLSCDSSKQRILLSVIARLASETRDAYQQYLKRQSDTSSYNITLGDTITKSIK